MPRNRIIYQSEGVFVGQRTPCTGTNHNASDVKEVYRVQNANYSFNLGRKDVLQFGELAAIDRVVIDPPTVSLDFSYLIANVYNERQLGFNVAAGAVPVGNMFTGLLGGTTDQRAYWVKTVGFGADLHNQVATGVSAFGVIGFGNCYISSYSVDANVGDFPKASVRVEASNIKFDNFAATDMSGLSPCINPLTSVLDGAFYTLPTGISTTSAVDQTSTLKPGDMVFTWDSYLSNQLGASITDAKIQSFTLSADIGRTPLNRLGSDLPFSFEINYPVNSTLRITAMVGDMNTGSLNFLIAETGKTTVRVQMFAPSGNVVNYGFDFKGAQLDSHEYSSDIGNGKTVTLSFTAPIGGVNDTTRGIFLSGMV